MEKLFLGRSIDILKGRPLGVDLGHAMTGGVKTCEPKEETRIIDRTGAKVAVDLSGRQLR